MSEHDYTKDSYFDLCNPKPEVKLSSMDDATIEHVLTKGWPPGNNDKVHPLLANQKDAEAGE